jgi:CHAT domain-containing protein
VAYVVTTETEFPEMVYLFEEKELNELLKYRSPNKIYALRGTEKISTSEPEYSGEDLYSLIIKPLEKHLEGKERIYFSTDGKLHQFSFAAFSIVGGELLCDKYELVQLNSTGQLALEERVPGKEPVILVGGIEFEYTINQTATKDSSIQYTYNYLEDESSKRSRSNYDRGSDWNYLPGTKAEVEKLIKIFEENGLSADTLTGIYATEESIKKLDGNSPSVLHIATHGFFFEDPETGDKESYSISEDPLMRSGLVLAGGNYAWKNGSNPYEREDGILTAYEISNLNLLKTDLVVLSACETGLGDIEGSEGVYGLQRAFRMAGVEYIIMSLWQVPDDETVEFMETFYTNWLGGQQIREAFNNTQKVMSKKYLEEPEKWAAFVLLE